VKLVTKLILLATLVSLSLSAETFQKPDIARFFHKLENQGQVTVVALGGSITAHRSGWAQRLVQKIRDTSPQTEVNFINAGISGTGSNLALFRLDRDVIRYRPDLVVIEFAVNDRSIPDEACLRNLESMVVRLRQLPNPPAIIFLESAARTGVKQSRHNQIASHYNILDVETQSVVEAYLAEHELEWNALYKDEIHPKEEGHKLYATILWNAMQENRDLPKNDHKSPQLPSPISETLILNPSLISPNFQKSGWDYLPEPTDDWIRLGFFPCSLQSGNEAESLHIPFYGKTIGVALLTLKGHGLLRVAIDGQVIKEIRGHHPNWYYSIYIHPELLSEDWHVLSLIPVSKDEQPAKIRIAYLMAEDQSNAPEPEAHFWQKTWPDSKALTKNQNEWAWRIIPETDWQVIGPFGGDSAWTQPNRDLNKDYGPKVSCAPDPMSTFPGYKDQDTSWQFGQGSQGWVDLKSMYGLHDRGVAYAYTSLYSAEAGTYTFLIALDYFAHIYVNGERVTSLLELHGSPLEMIPVKLPLKEGLNHIYLKVHAGSTGFGFRMESPKTLSVHQTSTHEATP
jgi:lysophospholipase L1-like esterase